MLDQQMVSRRDFLRTGVAAAAAASLPGCRSEPDAPRWDARAHRKPERSEVAILRAESYAGDLLDTVTAGLELFALEISGRRIVLKPNLVEFDPQGVINTHPALIAATIEAFLHLGAREVVVAEGPGHRRDNEYLLAESGLGEILRDTGIRYVDLNQDSVRPVRLLSSYTQLGTLYLPETVLDAELLVSMPKLKTHHWAGVTLSMKNMFGVVPGAVYGWPKNVLHWAGIGGSIIDINAALEVPRFNIVDGIVGMEGNGPIQGEPKGAGVLVFGADPVAVDATCARLMSIDPWRVSYLGDAEAFLGNIGSERIAQLAEDVDTLRQDFRVLESFETLKLTQRATAG
jgi:uncharacterized protein (DUF362 family)